MKTNLCDICYYQDHKLREGRWRLSFKRQQPYPQRIALDACPDHKNWLKQFKTFDEADKAVMALYSGSGPRPATLPDAPREKVEQGVPGAAKSGPGYHIAGAGTGGKKSQGFGVSKKAGFGNPLPPKAIN
jgi:hypothetical protein